MQTLFKSNLFSSSSSKMGAKSFMSGGKKLGSSIVGAAKNNIVNFARTAQAMIPQKKEEKENNFIKNYTNFFGSKKTEKILRKNLKLVRDSLVNTFEIAKLLKASIVSITKDLKGKGIGKGGGIFGSLLAGGLGGILVAALPALAAIVAAGGLLAFGIALWKSPEFRTATLEFIGKSAKTIVGFLKDNIFRVLKENFPNIFLAVTDLPGLVKNAVAAALGLQSTPAKIDIEFNELNEELAAAGMDKDGTNMSLRGKDKRNMRDLPNEGRTPEQQIVYEKVMGRKNQLENLKKQVKNVENQVPMSESYQKRERGKMKTFYKHSDEDKKIIKEKKKEVLNQGLLEYKSDDNQTVSTPPPPTTNTVDAVKSDLNNISFADSLKMSEGGSIFNLQPIPTTIGDATNKSGSGGDVTSTSNGGTSGGDAVTFYSSSNPDSSYHKLNALMTFNIV